MSRRDDVAAQDRLFVNEERTALVRIWANGGGEGSESGGVAWSS